jgi:alkylation response protein AidB-like acyl-CoA dehydrogenase
MQFTVDPDQQALVNAIEQLTRRQAGTERAKELGANGHDDELLATLDQGGYLDLAIAEGAGPLAAALSVEVITKAVGRINAGVRMLVAPAMLGADAPPRVALADMASRGPVRFGGYADVVLVLAGDEALVVRSPSSEPVASKFGYPYAAVDLDGGVSLGAGSGEKLRRWWRVAIAVETTGALSGGLERTVRYLGEREQFGRKLASFQALQHRLAEAHVTAEGVRWLGRVAAYRDAAQEDAAAAAAYAGFAARGIGADLHQLTGAIGFTYEYDLHLWTTRLHALRVELGGLSAQRVALAHARWT